MQNFKQVGELLRSFDAKALRDLIQPPGLRLAVPMPQAGK